MIVISNIGVLNSFWLGFIFKIAFVDNDNGLKTFEKFFDYLINKFKTKKKGVTVIYSCLLRNHFLHSLLKKIIKFNFKINIK